MCGIVGGVAQRDVTPILVEGLRRLEYRGYDSAGIAVINRKRSLERLRVLGKVDKLQASLKDTVVQGSLGIAHTRWATHGEPSTRNAHPHVSNDCVALVHNGIIENHNKLRLRQSEKGYQFTSDTDTEVAVHRIYGHTKQERTCLPRCLTRRKSSRARLPSASLAHRNPTGSLPRGAAARSSSD